MDGRCEALPWRGLLWALPVSGSYPQEHKARHVGPSAVFVCGRQQHANPACTLGIHVGFACLLNMFLDGSWTEPVACVDSCARLAQNMLAAMRQSTAVTFWCDTVRVLTRGTTGWIVLGCWQRCPFCLSTLWTEHVQSASTSSAVPLADSSFTAHG
eukprot:jgi/Ulvmu1/754/UM010_0128.1